jgi:hypothetical protein
VKSQNHLPAFVDSLSDTLGVQLHVDYRGFDSETLSGFVEISRREDWNWTMLLYVYNGEVDQLSGPNRPLVDWPWPDEQFELAADVHPPAILTADEVIIWAYCHNTLRYGTALYKKRRFLSFTQTRPCSVNTVIDSTRDRIRIEPDEPWHYLTRYFPGVVDSHLSPRSP